MKTPSYSITKSAITVVFPGVGRPITIGSSYQSQYHQGLNAIKNQDWATLKRVSDFALALKQYAGKFNYRDGDCFFNGRKLHNIVTSKIKEFWLSSLPVDSLVKFLENCLQNPSPKAIEELYLFLEKNSFTLTEDGHFLAWRKVDENYNSYHSNPDGTHNRNLVGDTVFKDRNLCDPNRDQTCAPGLHFCAYEYLPFYCGNQGRTMLVKVNPINVVAIPSDYDNAKGRCCEYEVVEEVLDGETNNVFSGKSYFSTSQDGVQYYNKRDRNGRFVKLQ